MRGALGLLSRVLLVGLVLTGAALIGHLYAKGLLSRTQFESASGDLVRQMRATIPPLVRSRKLLGAVAFLVGAIAGWMAALRWIGGRLRHRPLIIADFRHADMSFADGIRHIRSNTLPPVDDDVDAIWLILHEASHGRLTVWRRASADTLWRVPSRQVRAVATHLSDASRATWSTGPWQNFMLLAAEVEQLWPSRHSLRITPSPGMVVSAGR